MAIAALGHTASANAKFLLGFTTHMKSRPDYFLFMFSLSLFTFRFSFFTFLSLTVVVLFFHYSKRSLSEFLQGICIEVLSDFRKPRNFRVYRILTSNFSLFVFHFFQSKRRGSKSPDSNSPVSKRLDSIFSRLTSHL